MAGLLVVWGFFGTAAPVGWGTWLSRALRDDAEAGGGLQVAVIQLAITVGAAAGGLMFDAVGWWSTLALAMALLVGSSCAAWAAWFEWEKSTCNRNGSIAELSLSRPCQRCHAGPGFGPDGQHRKREGRVHEDTRCLQRPGVHGHLIRQPVGPGPRVDPADGLEVSGLREQRENRLPAEEVDRGRQRIRMEDHAAVLGNPNGLSS